MRVASLRSRLEDVPEEFVDSEWPKEWPGIQEEKMSQQKGYVQWVGSKPYGSSMTWTFRLKNVEMWFNCGAQNPNVQTGEHIEFDYTEKNGRSQVNVGSIKKLSSSPEVHQGTPSGSLAQRSVQGKSEYQVKEQYWSDKAKGDVERDLRIQWQSARNAAIEVVGILVSSESLKLPEKNKSDAILGKISDLTDRFYRESGSVGQDATPEEGTEASTEAA